MLEASSALVVAASDKQRLELRGCSVGRFSFPTSVFARLWIGGLFELSGDQNGFQSLGLYVLDLLVMIGVRR